MLIIKVIAHYLSPPPPTHTHKTVNNSVVLYYMVVAIAALQLQFLLLLLLILLLSLSPSNTLVTCALTPTCRLCRSRTGRRKVAEVLWRVPLPCVAWVWDRPVIKLETTSNNKYTYAVLITGVWDRSVIKQAATSNKQYTCAVLIN